MTLRGLSHRFTIRGLVVGAFALLVTTSAKGAPPAVEVRDFNPGSGIRRHVQSHPEGLEIRLEWRIDDTETGRLDLDVRAGRPLIRSLGIVETGSEPKIHEIVADADPEYVLTVGTRKAPSGRPPGMSPFNTFFDSPASRPHESHRARLEIDRIRLCGETGRASIVVDTLTAGPFRGALQFNVYEGSRLVHVEAVLRTEESDRAFFYDTGLFASKPNWTRLSWTDAEGHVQTADDPATADRPLAVRHRTIVAESPGGSVACFPPPHQFFFARDLTDNLRYVWYGRGHHDLDRPGFGIRQTETGGGNFSPWYNAPPGTDQRLSVFYLLMKGPADEAIRETLRYTHGDHFPSLPGALTFTSHWHMAIAVAAMREIAQGRERTTPEFVRMFKDLGVNLVHLAEFHGDGHQFDPGPLRFPEMAAMFAECRRLSDDRLLLIPGEEVAGILDVKRPGKGDGHWMYLFPRPVHLSLRRSADQPFEETDANYGKVYRVGGADDMARLLEREHGLAWTSHPRIKASSWTPDAFRDEPFFKAGFWLGAAWKGMPVDLSEPRLGSRALDLLDDMNNWGARKQLPGEVDVFKLDHTHELYGHMNVNYLRLERMPRFDEGWRPVLEALRAGRFFTTTGELLVREFTVGGRESGETLRVSSAERPKVRLSLEWTFPPRFAEIVFGDGRRVERQRVDLADAGPFGRRTLTLRPDLQGRTWIRAGAWDIAANGAYTQPVWLETSP